MAFLLVATVSSVQLLSRVRLFPRHGLQHTRLPCSLPTLRACLNSCPSNWWCQPTTSVSVVPFSSCLQSFPVSVFSEESDVCIRWSKCWSFSFNISPSNEHPGLIFRKKRYKRLNSLSIVSQLASDKDWVPSRLVLELMFLTINNAIQSLD